MFLSSLHLINFNAMKIASLQRFIMIFFHTNVVNIIQIIFYSISIALIVINFYIGGYLLYRIKKTKFYSAWIMPERLKLFLNQGYNEDTDKEMPEEDLLDNIKQQLSRGRD